MDSVPFRSPTRLRSIPPGTLAAACSGDLFRRKPGITTGGTADSESQRSRGSNATKSKQASVGFAVFEIDPPIPLSLDDKQKAQLTMERARLVRCNDTLARVSGYTCIDEVEGVSLAELLGTGRSSCEAYFQAFFEHDLVYEGLTEEEDRSGRIRIFTNRSVGVERQGLLYEVIMTKTRFRSDASALDDTSCASHRGPCLIALIRDLDRNAVAALLDRAHDELVQRRHAMLEYQEHGPSGKLLPQLVHRSTTRPEPDAQEVLARAQTTVLCVLERAILEQSARARRRAFRLDGRPMSSAAAASVCADGRATPDTRELSGVLNALDRILPGAAERMLAEVLLHWKVKEDFLRREPPRTSLLESLGRRAVRHAARALFGDPTFGCLLRVLRSTHCYA